MASTSLLIVLAGLIADRERKGYRWCRKNGIGKRRQFVGAVLPPTIKNPSVAAYIGAQREAASVLAAECRRCRGCELSRVPIMGNFPDSDDASDRS